MSLFRRLLSFLQSSEPESSSTPDSLESTLGVELTRLPPALDLSYHVMREDGQRAGILLVSESGRKLPFLGTWVEGAGGLFHSDAELKSVLATSPVPSMTRMGFSEKRFEPSVVLVPLSSPPDVAPLVTYGVYVLRRFGLGTGSLDKATFFLRHDWMQAVVWPPTQNEAPHSLSAFVAVGGHRGTSALVLPTWWHEVLQGDLAETARGGKPVSAWEELNKVWRIHLPERVQQRVATWKAEGKVLPEEAGGDEALTQFSQFLDSGLTRGAEFHHTML
jgi:hypothetical protein